MIYVLYHKNCTDGFGAAYAAWKKFKDSAVYIPVSHHEPLPEVPALSEVYVVDFCLPPMITRKIKKTSHIVTLDHHVTSVESIKESDEFTLDMNRSGAKIAWDYFHPGKRNELIDYISDKDLNRFALPHSREISAALESYPRDFELWDSFTLDQLKAEGSHVFRSKCNEVNLLIAKSYVRNIGGYEVPVVNTPTFMSEVAEKLLDMYPEAKFSAAYHIYEQDGKLYNKWSLRSKGFDVSKVAAMFGGGGHKGSAGYTEFVKDVKSGNS